MLRTVAGAGWFLRWGAVSGRLRILAGNAVMPTIDAACKIARVSKFLYWLVVVSVTRQLFCIRHRTASALQHYPHHWQSRSDILADIAHQFWHIPHEKIWIETSQQTVVKTHALASRYWIRRRTSSHSYRCSGPHHAAAHEATFRRMTGDNPDAPRWLSYPDSFLS